MAFTSPYTDIQNVRRLLRDEDVDEQHLGDANLDDAIQAAVERYSQVKPDRSTVDLTGNGTKFYDISDLTGFIEEWSYIETVEYPADSVSSTHNPEFLDESSGWRWYRDETVTYLWFPNHSPSSSETVRVTFTIPRVLTSGSDTIVSEHKDAVLSLAAGYCCETLAARYSSISDPLVQADVANWQSAQRRYQAAAEMFKKRFEERLGLGKSKEVHSAGVRHDWDMRGYRRGLRPRLIHYGRW